MKTCPKCQSQVNENLRFCTNCGANFQGGESREAKVSRTKWYVIGGSGVVLGDTAADGELERE